MSSSYALDVKGFFLGVWVINNFSKFMVFHIFYYETLQTCTKVERTAL